MMESVLIRMFAAIGFIVTFMGAIFGLIKLHNFFEDEFPQIQMKQSDIFREIDFLKQRIREFEEKVND